MTKQPAYPEFWSQLGQDFGLPSGYSEEITTLGGTGTVLPDQPTSFLISEFGLGYGNVFKEESMNSAGTSATVGDFILTPFGNENITPIVDLFLPQGVGINGLAAGAVSAAANGASIPAATPAELLSDASTNYTDANQLLSAIPSGPDYSANIATTIDVQDKLLQGIANVGSAESALSSYDNGALSDLLNPWFTSVDQGWDQVSEAALSSDQALESAVSTGSATSIETALAGTLGPVYEALGPAFQSDFVDIAAHLLTGIDPVTAGLDPYRIRSRSRHHRRRAVINRAVALTAPLAVAVIMSPTGKSGHGIPRIEQLRAQRDAEPAHSSTGSAGP